MLDLRGEELRVAARGERHDFELVGVLRHNVEGLVSHSRVRQGLFRVRVRVRVRVSVHIRFVTTRSVRDGVCGFVTLGGRFGGGGGGGGGGLTE